MTYTIGQIAALLSREYTGDGTRLLTRVAKPETADQTSLIFVQGSENAGIQFANPPGCVIAKKDGAPAGMNVIYSEQPKLDFARAAQYLHPRQVSCGIRHATAEI